MRIKLTILLTYVILLANAQAPERFFNKFGGFGIDNGYGIKETFDRQYVLVGSTSSYGYGGLDAFVMLIDSMGQKKWEKNFGGVLTDVAKSVIVNPTDSGFVFTGYTNSIGNGGYDVYVVRTDKNGNIIWQRTYGGFDWDFGNNVILSQDGELLICGHSYSNSYGKSDGLLLKLKIQNGDLIWQKHYGGAEDDDFRSLKLTPDSKLIITGKTTSYADSLGDIFYFQTNTNGDSLSSKSYGLKNKVDYGNDIISETNTNYFIVGGTESYSSGMKDAFILKINNQGDSIWLRNFGKSDVDEETYGIVLTNSYQGKYVITFGAIDFAFFKRDPKTITLESNGYYMFGGSLGQNEDEELVCLANTKHKGFVGIGYTKSFGSVLEDVFVMKYDSILGINASNSLIGVEENSNIVSKTKVYPTVINDRSSQVNIHSVEDLMVNIYNMNGDKVMTLNFNAQNNTAAISLNSYPPGIYFFELMNERYRNTFKIVKTRD